VVLLFALAAVSGSDGRGDGEGAGDGEELEELSHRRDL
jgi:hypothetical protein